MLSKGGRCKTFDDSASGYARGTTGAAMFWDRDGSQAAPGSALNQDGRSSNLTSPNGPQAVVLSALAEAQVNPASHLCSLEQLRPAGEHMLRLWDTRAACVETHGTGTALGDPMEVGALQTALANGRSRPLQLGAAKTNVGHLEGGAGPSSSFPCASVSSFGFGGTNGHVVLAATAIKAEKKGLVEVGGWRSLMGYL
eukprot:Skav203404  [mRNA]  locus=scaffold1743:124059:130030:- [translate_table: standard]